MNTDTDGQTETEIVARAEQAWSRLISSKRAELRLPDTRQGRRRAERAVRADVLRWKRDR